MSSTSDPSDKAGGLQSELTTRLGERLKPFGIVDSPADWSSDEATLSRHLWSPANGEILRVAGHFDPAVDCLVYDATLASIGLVTWISARAASSGTPEELGDRITEITRDAIDEAVYVRHLFLTDPSLEGSGSWATEIVLGIQEAHTHHLSTALQGLTRGIALDHVGVNLLRYDPSEPEFDQQKLDKAFCWLFRHTRSWLGSIKRPTDAPPPLKSLEIEDFRVRGKRALDLDKDERTDTVHVVHGSNGTGKSSFVEALELVLTNEIERVERKRKNNNVPPQRAYRDIVTNRHAVEQAEEQGSFAAARVTLKRESGQAQEWSVGEGGLPVENGDPSHARAFGKPLSFRLDQPSMDQLCGQDDAARYESLLDAFFAAERPELEAVHEARARHEAAIDAKSNSDRELDDLKSEVATVRRTLERLTGWSVSESSRRGESWEQTLDLWMRALALSDLAQRSADTVALLGKVENQERGKGEEWIDLLRPLHPNLERLENAAEHWKSQATAYAAALKDRKIGSDRADATTVSAELTEAETAALNHVGSLVDESGGQDLGDRLRSALRTDSTQKFSGIQLGETGWAMQLSRRVNRLSDWIADPTLPRPDGRSQGDPEDPAHEPDDLVSRVIAIRRVLQETSGEKSQAEETAVGLSLEEMEDPLNEILAMFTPARWAYERLVVRLTPDGKLILGLAGLVDPDDPAGHADVSFNTAELNLLALSIFLLCSVKQENPLRLVVLDDPLQNMDELTVTAVARGLSRITRLWRNLEATSDWKILVLLHGHGNLRRLASEIEGWVHRLPWLRANPQGDESSVQTEATSRGAHECLFRKSFLRIVKDT